MRTIVMFFLSFIVAVYAEDKDLEKLFKSKGVNGTIVIASLDGKTQYIHNEERSKTRFLPASTFKIPNALIALELKVVAADSPIVQWDGIDRNNPDWNKDQTLSSAFKSSCVWFFQKIATRVGIDKYREYLDKLDYGNRNIGSRDTSFWLDGDFAISAVEQIRFLRNILTGKTPFSSQNIETLKHMMIVDSNDKFIVRAKTGWSSRIKPQHGWYVGYVEKGKSLWLFAANIAIRAQQDLSMRKEITMAALKVKKITY